MWWSWTSLLPCACAQYSSLPSCARPPCLRDSRPVLALCTFGTLILIALCAFDVRHRLLSGSVLSTLTLALFSRPVISISAPMLCTFGTIRPVLALVFSMFILVPFSRCTFDICCRSVLALDAFDVCCCPMLTLYAFGNIALFVFKTCFCSRSVLSRLSRSVMFAVALCFRNSRALCFRWFPSLYARALYFRCLLSPCFRALCFRCLLSPCACGLCWRLEPNHCQISKQNLFIQTRQPKGIVL